MEKKYTGRATPTGGVLDDFSCGIGASIGIVGRSPTGPSSDARGEGSRRIEGVRGRFDFDTGTLHDEIPSATGRDVLANHATVLARYPLAVGAITVDPDAEAVLDELVGIADAQGDCVMLDGNVLSGAVALGWWSRKGDAAVSDVATRAELLRRRLGVPVLAVDDSLYNHVLTHSRRHAYVQHVDPAVTLFRRYDGPYQGERISFLFLDYIRICLEAVDWADSPERVVAYQKALPGVDRHDVVVDGYAAGVAEWLSQHALKIERAHDHADAGQRAPFIWLAGYHNAMVLACAAPAVCRCTLASAAAPAAHSHFSQAGQ